MGSRPATIGPVRSVLSPGRWPARRRSPRCSTTSPRRGAGSAIVHPSIMPSAGTVRTARATPRGFGVTQVPRPRRGGGTMTPIGGTDRRGPVDAVRGRRSGRLQRPGPLDASFQEDRRRHSWTIGRGNGKNEPGRLRDLTETSAPTGMRRPTRPSHSAQQGGKGDVRDLSGRAAGWTRTSTSDSWPRTSTPAASTTTRRTSTVGLRTRLRPWPALSLAKRSWTSPRAPGWRHSPQPGRSARPARSWAWTCRRACWPWRERRSRRRGCGTSN